MSENQKNPDGLFLVSSAIHTNHGIYNTEQRLEQTINTLKSIRQRCDVDIILLDGGLKAPSDEERKVLEEYTDSIVSFSDAPSMKDILAIPSQDIVKNMAEIVMFGSTFQDIGASGEYKKYKRIFKMSGRYLLNDNFNYQTHIDAKDKIIIRGPYTSQFTSAQTGGVIFQYMSRLWSFDAALLPDIAQAYARMFKDMNMVLTSGGYIDIEHLLFTHLDPSRIQKIAKIGVEGNIAPNGTGISE
jgi:hypothetical protein